MRTLFVTDPPPPVEDWLARRRALGQDRFDEVWEGEYHVSPEASNRHAKVQVQLIELLGPLARRAGLLIGGPINVGRPTDFRVPDVGYVRREEDPVWNPTAALVVEVISPGDESRRKLGFYHGVGVEEVLLVDPDTRTVEWLVRGADRFEPTDGSALLDITTAELAAALTWPA
ncbi:MAG: Uma2 family endonuclease [Chloroflexi bacterium]|nr:Uma2 family endonuclease [Chloroflexota bacterium]